MQDNFNFNLNKHFEIKNENVSAILFDVDVKKADGITVCDIANLNNIRVDLMLKRQSSKEPTVIYKGFLTNLLNILYTQSTEYDLVVKKLASGYKFLIKFRNLPITLTGEDKLILDLYFPTSSFTAAVSNNSSITIETIESDVPNQTGVIAVYEDYVIDSGKSSFDGAIGNNVSKILLEVDNSATYDASTSAKPTNVDILASGDFSKSVTENALIVQNMHMLHYNPTTQVKNLWLFNSDKKLLNKGTARIKFDKALTASKLITVQRLIFA